MNFNTLVNRAVFLLFRIRSHDRKGPFQFGVIMKLIIFFTIAASLQATAGALAQRITISVKNETLKGVLKEIRKQSGYSFIYSDLDMKGAKAVTLDIVNKEIAQVLPVLFNNQSLTYSIDGKFINISSSPVKSTVNSSVIAKESLMQGAITGYIFDQANNPLAGASVQIRGTQYATKTDTKGHFFFSIRPDNSMLIISFLGYKPIEISTDQDLSHIQMSSLTNNLEEVNVVFSTGYQSIAKERSAGSFAKPSKEQLVNRSNSLNLIQNLDGLVPGLTVNNSPGSDNILIRGLSSINSNRSPLVVVDGIPVADINAINPQDVEDVTVLKDATAASIWGAKASNGVIVITTKRGSNTEKIAINYDAFINFQGKPDLSYLPVLSSKQYIQSAREIFDPVVYPWNLASSYQTGSVGVPPHEQILYDQYRGLISQELADKRLDSLASINNTEQIRNLWFRNASLLNQNLSLAGGSKFYQFYGAFSHSGTRSNIPGASNNIYKFNIRQDFNFYDRVKLFLITDVSNAKQSAPRNVQIDSRFYPYQLFSANGTDLSMPYVGTLSDPTRLDAERRSLIGLDYVPFLDRELAQSKSSSLLNRIVGGATVKIFQGLRYEGTFGYTSGKNKSTLYDDNRSFVQRMELVNFTVVNPSTGIPTYYLPVSGGKYAITNSGRRDWTIRNQLSYDQNWDGLKHQATILVGQELQEQLNTLDRTTVRGYNGQLLNAAPIDYAALSLGLNGTVIPNTLNRSVLPNDNFFQSEVQTRFKSYYANGGYTYQQKYTVNGSWRLDKSNLFGLETAAQSKPVWSAGVKWNVGEESFVKKRNIFQSLALRGTYGITGNAPTPGSASSFNILTSSTIASLPGGRSYSIASPANPNIAWEMTTNLNLGLDFSVLKDRLSASVDYYQRNTKNLIGQMPVNSLTGYTIIVGNYGDLNNHGLDLNIRSTNLIKGNFRWSTLLNLAYNKNKITKLNYATPLVTGQQFINGRYFEGYPAFALFAYRYAGLDNLGDPQIYLNDGSITKSRNVAMKDDMAYMGSAQPLWNGGLTNSFSYKGWRLDVNMIFNFGHVMRRDVGDFFAGRLIGTDALLRSQGAYSSAINLAQGNINAIFMDRWRQPGDEHLTDVPSYVSSTALSNSRRDINYYSYGDLNVISASYVKMRDITLAYSLPQNILDRLHSKQITLRAQVSNIMLWKANKFGIDPEFQGANLIPGVSGVPDSFSSVNRSLRTMQGTVTFGAHLSF